MHLEHLGLNHRDPAAAAAWYCKHLGMTVARKTGPPSYCHFLADGRGKMMLEFYADPTAAVPDYAKIEPFSLHIAFHVDNVHEAFEALLEAGGSPAMSLKTNDRGDDIAILRDPWGIPVQLVRRAKPMV